MSYLVRCPGVMVLLPVSFPMHVHVLLYTESKGYYIAVVSLARIRAWSLLAMEITACDSKGSHVNIIGHSLTLVGEIIRVEIIIG